MKSLDFSIESLDPAVDGVPVGLLTSVLEGAQRALYLFAVLHEGRPVQQRARISPDLEKKYQMTIGVTRAGSYVIPARIGESAADLLAEPDVEAVVSRFTDFGQALGDGQVDSARQMIPDPRMLFRVVDAFRGMLPRPGSAWRLRVSNGARRALLLDQSHVALLPKVLGAEDDEAIHTVTGRLTKIAFDEHKLTIEYPPTRVELQCFYQDAVEEMLLENRREMIQVTGRVIFDRHRHPKRIVDVTDIRDLDLSPFHVHEVPVFSKDQPARVLRFRHPLLLTPTVDETGQLLCLLYPRFHIDVFAETREELLSELYEQVVVLWEEYALEHDARLAPDARRLKASLLEGMEESCLG